MSRPINYYKIGMLVVSGAILVVITLMMLGGDRLLQHPTYFETYIDESVEGLEIGSSVKFRGVAVGEVKEISFISKIYGGLGKHGGEDLGPKYDRYIYIKMSIHQQFLKQYPGENLQYALNQSVKEGLRVRLMPQGLTGNSYLEIDYVDADHNPPLHITWRPKDYYIPSASSTFTKITDFFSDFHKLNIPQFVEKANILVDRADSILQELDVTAVQTRTLASLKAVTEAANGIDKFAVHLNRLADRGDFDKTMANLRATSQSLRRAAKNVGPVMSSINRTSQRINKLVKAEQANVSKAIDNIQVTTQNLRDLSSSAKDYPAQLIVGRPPPPLNLRNP